MTKHITLKGISFQVDDDFNDDDPTEIAALGALADYVHAHIPPLTPEQEKRQAASRERIRARNARLRRTEKPDG